MIKFNDNNISKWLDGESSIKKAYYQDHVCYSSVVSGSTPTPPAPTAQTVEWIELPSSGQYAGLISVTMPNANQYYELDFKVSDVSGKNLYIIGQASEAETISFQMKFSCYSFPYYDYGGGRLSTSYSSMGAVGSRCKVGIGVYTGDTKVEIRELDTDTRLASATATPSYAEIPLLFGCRYKTNTEGDIEASSGFSSGIRYYGVKVYESGTLIANYVPAKDPTTNKYTLYETISGKYCEQFGDGTIIGQDIT